MLRILVVGLVLLVGAMMLLPRPQAPLPEVASMFTEARPLPEIALTDTEGQAFSLDNLRGQYTLMFFGFTHCTDICPPTLLMLAEARKRLADRTPPQILFVSVDPHRDTPQVIAEYLEFFDADFKGVTGSDAALAPWVKALGITVHKTEQDGEYYNMVHNGTLFVIGPEAELVAVFGGSAHSVDTVANDFLRIRAHAGGLY
jgi:protein SCO1/2